MLLILLACGTSRANQAAGPGRKGSVQLGLSMRVNFSDEGRIYGGLGEVEYFLADGVAPGLSAEVGGGQGRPALGLIMATLHLVPLRIGPLAVFVVGRAGRALVSSQGDGWAAGGGGGLELSYGRMGLQVSYEILGVMPLNKGSRLDALGAGATVCF